MKEYFKKYSLEDARTKFALDTKMLQSVKTNFFSDKEYSKDLWQCEAGCGRVDSARHVMVCPGYEELRTNRNMEDSLDTVHFFQDVMKLRMNLTDYSK